jgi:hypothetical protein
MKVVQHDGSSGSIRSRSYPKLRFISRKKRTETDKRLAMFKEKYRAPKHHDFDEMADDLLAVFAD